MLKDLEKFLSLPLNWVMAFCLVLPTYIIFFIGKEPVVQGLGYSLYLIPLVLIIIRREFIFPSWRFTSVWVVFLLLWLVPNLLNYHSGKVESTHLSLSILFVNVILMSALALTLYNYINGNYKKVVEELLPKIFWVMLPMVLLISLKILYLVIKNPFRPLPFAVQPNVVSEIFLSFLLISLWLHSNLLKWSATLLAIAMCYLLESRGALISCYLALIICYIYPSIKFLFFSRILWLGFLLLGLIGMFFYEDIFLFFQSFLLLDIRVNDLYGRGSIWKIAIDSIEKYPLTGLGYWVNPHNFPLWLASDYGAHLMIHNAYLRIASENGLGLLVIIIVFILVSLVRFLRHNSFKEVAMMISILFFLSFNTRHLTLNFLNVLLYILIIYAWSGFKFRRK